VCGSQTQCARPPSGDAAAKLPPKSATRLIALTLAPTHGHERQSPVHHGPVGAGSGRCRDEPHSFLPGIRPPIQPSGTPLPPPTEPGDLQCPALGGGAFQANPRPFTHRERATARYIHVIKASIHRPWLHCWADEAYGDTDNDTYKLKATCASSARIEHLRRHRSDQLPADQDLRRRGLSNPPTNPPSSKGRLQGQSTLKPTAQMRTAPNEKFWQIARRRPAATVPLLRADLRRPTSAGKAVIFRKVRL